VSVTVTVCRDCCCGTKRKHPDVDHDAQLNQLREALNTEPADKGEGAGTGRLVVSQCLLACERSNVVVVTPAPGARNGGARPVWLYMVLTDDQTSAVAEWVRAGGPGLAPLPGVLEPLVGERPSLLPAGAY
jgi:predicted metal-binding protein